MKVGLNNVHGLLFRARPPVSESDCKLCRWKSTRLETMNVVELKQISRSRYYVYFLKDFIYVYFLERAEWREKEREKSVDWLALAYTLTGD